MQSNIVFLESFMHQLHSLPIQFFEFREDSIRHFLPKCVIYQELQWSATKLRLANRTMGILDILVKEFENAALAKCMVTFIDCLGIAKQPFAQRTSQKLNHFFRVHRMLPEILIHYINKYIYKINHSL